MLVCGDVNTHRENLNWEWRRRAARTRLQRYRKVTLLLATLAYLDQPVLWAEPGTVRGRSRVEGADELAGPGSVTVQVEAVTIFRAHQVAETRRQSGRVHLGLRMGLGLTFGLGRGLLETGTKYDGIMQ